MNEKVLEIDYSQEVVKVTTTQGLYLGKKVISSLPLGVLQSSTVRFVPALPSSYLAVIDMLDASVHEKVIVSFEKPFWQPQSKWLSFVRRNMTKSMYQMAHVLPSRLHKHVLMLFISGNDARKLLTLTDD
jgi:monoamine oxidase